MVEFTKAELLAISGWAMDAADRAKKIRDVWPEPYEKAYAIFKKAHQEYIDMEKEDR